MDKVPFFLSIVLTDANHQCVPQYRAILWRKTVIIINFVLFFNIIVILNTALEKGGGERWSLGLTPFSLSIKYMILSVMDPENGFLDKK